MEFCIPRINGDNFWWHQKTSRRYCLRTLLCLRRCSCQVNKKILHLKLCLVFGNDLHIYWHKHLSFKKLLTFGNIVSSWKKIVIKYERQYNYWGLYKITAYALKPFFDLTNILMKYFYYLNESYKILFWRILCYYWIMKTSRCTV